MANVTVISAQWGDRTRESSSTGCRTAPTWWCVPGSHNAGHTLVVGNRVQALLLPRAWCRASFVSATGVWDLGLSREIGIGAQGWRSAGLLVLADNAALILPLHRDLDQARERQAGVYKIGTTGRGIGPAYEDKVGRRAIRVADLADPAALEAKIERLLAHHGALRRGLDLPEADGAALLASLLEVAPKVLPFAQPAWRVLDKVVRAGRRVLFEGAQGALLDVDHGTYPFVTSSNTVAGQAAAGSGVGPRVAGYVLGIVKAYTTRVGESLHRARRRGRRGTGRWGEVGTVTGRSRRCGWFDAALVRQSVMLNGIAGIALTKLDVLDGLPTLKICTGYMLNGQPISYLPAGLKAQAALTPVYEELEGWSGATQGARSFRDLPASAIKYVRRIEELIGAPVALLSTSPQRDDTILMRDPFQD